MRHTPLSDIDIARFLIERAMYFSFTGNEPYMPDYDDDFPIFSQEEGGRALAHVLIILNETGR